MPGLVRWPSLTSCLFPGRRKKPTPPSQSGFGLPHLTSNETLPSNPRGPPSPSTGLFSSHHGGPRSTPLIGQVLIQALYFICCELQMCVVGACVSAVCMCKCVFKVRVCTFVRMVFSLNCRPNCPPPSKMSPHPYRASESAQTLEAQAKEATQCSLHAIPTPRAWPHNSLTWDMVLTQLFIKLLP